MDTHVNADRLKLGWGAGWDASWWCTPVAEGVLKGVSDDGDIGIGNTERGSGQTNVLDEPSNLAGVQGHELVGLVHAGGTSVWAGGVGELAAAEEVSKVGVQVGEEHVLGGVGAVGWHVVHEGSGGATVKEVDGDTAAATVVGGGEGTGEVWEQVDARILASSRSKETRDGNTDIGLGVVANDRSVNDESLKERMVSKCLGRGMAHRLRFYEPRQSAGWQQCCP